MIGWKCFFPPKGLKTFSKLLEAPKEFKQKWLFLPQSQSQRQQKRFYFLLYLDFTSKTQAPLGALGRQRSFLGVHVTGVHQAVWWCGCQYDGGQRGVHRQIILRYCGSMLRPPDTTIILYIAYNLYSEHERSIALILLIDSKGGAVTSMSFSIWKFQSPKLLQTSFPPRQGRNDQWWFLVPLNRWYVIITQ